MSVINNRGILSGMWEESREQLIKQDTSCFRRRAAFTMTNQRAQALKRQKQLPQVHIWTWHLKGVRLNATCVATRWAEKWRNRSDPAPFAQPVASDSSPQEQRRLMFAPSCWKIYDWMTSGTKSVCSALYFIKYYLKKIKEMRNCAEWQN